MWLLSNHTCIKASTRRLQERSILLFQKGWTEPNPDTGTWRTLGFLGVVVFRGSRVTPASDRKTTGSGTVPGTPKGLRGPEPHEGAIGPSSLLP